MLHFQAVYSSFLSPLGTCIKKNRLPPLFPFRDFHLPIFAQHWGFAVPFTAMFLISFCISTASLRGVTWRLTVAAVLSPVLQTPRQRKTSLPPSLQLPLQSKSYFFCQSLLPSLRGHFHFPLTSSVLEQCPITLFILLSCPVLSFLNVAPLTYLTLPSIM